MSVELYNEDLNESIVDGYVRIDLVRTYLVITSSRSTSAFGARNQAGIPSMGSIFLTPTGEKLVVTNRHPRRPQVDESGRKWFIDVTFSNGTQDYPRDIYGNPVKNPTQAIKDVDISYLEFQEDVNSAILKTITKRSPSYDATAADLMQTPPWLAEKTQRRGTVTNTALINQDAQKASFRKLITVSRFVSSWTDYSSYLGKINSDTVTITQGDASGTKLTETCDPFTLLLQDVIKEDYWSDGILYFRQRFVLSKNERTWIYSIKDEGTHRLCIVDDQFKPDNSGDKMDQAYLDAANITSTWGHEPIVTTDQNGNAVTVGEPVPFNGWGSNAPNDRLGQYDDYTPHFLNYQVNEITAFAPLEL